MKTGPRGKANAKKNYKRPMGRNINSASTPSTNPDRKYVAPAPTPPPVEGGD